MIIRFAKLHDDAQIPKRMTEHAAGFDLFAYCEPPEDADAHAFIGWSIAPGDTFTVHTGIAVQIPPGYEGQVRPRSGLAAAFGVTVLNAPGTIDPDYRGEVMVMLINHGDTNYMLKHGDRVAQLVFCPTWVPETVEIGDLDASERGNGGLGSTGR